MQTSELDVQQILRVTTMEEETSPHNKENISTKPIITGPQLPNVDDFNLFKPISRGAYGKVYLAYKRTNAEEVFAVKVMKKAEMKYKNMADRVTTERDVMAHSNSPFVTQIFYSFHSDQNVFLVMEYLIGGDLKSLLHVYGVLRETEAVYYTAQIIQALIYLHSNGIVHRDLKPDNMLISAKGHLKLTDFGLSKIMNHEVSDIPGDQVFTTPAKLPNRTPGQVVSLATSLGMNSFQIPPGPPIPMSTSTLEESTATNASIRATQSEKFNKTPKRLFNLENKPILTPQQIQIANSLTQKPILTPRPDIPNNLSISFDIRKPSESTETITKSREKLKPRKLSTKSHPMYNSTPLIHRRKKSQPLQRRSSFKRKNSTDSTAETKRLCIDEHRSLVGSRFEFSSHSTSIEDLFGTPSENMKIDESEMSITGKISENLVLDYSEMALPSPICRPEEGGSASDLCVEELRGRVKDSESLKEVKKVLDERREALRTVDGLLEDSLCETHESLVEQVRQFQDSEIRSIKDVLSMLGESAYKSPPQRHKSYCNPPKSVRRGVYRTEVPILGTADYLAPELVQKQPHSFPVDWWALGVCLFEFLTGIPPFNDDTVEQVFEHIVNREIPWPLPEEEVGEVQISTAARFAINSLLTLDPTARPGSNETKKFAIFEQLDWIRLLDMPAPFIPLPDDKYDTVYFKARNYVQRLDVSAFEK